MSSLSSQNTRPEAEEGKFKGGADKNPNSANSTSEAIEHLMQAKELFIRAARDLAKESNQNVSQKYQEGREEALRRTEEGRQLISDKPLASLGVAFGLGVLVSFLFRK